MEMNPQENSRAQAAGRPGPQNPMQPAPGRPVRPMQGGPRPLQRGRRPLPGYSVPQKGSAIPPRQGREGLYSPEQQDRMAEVHFEQKKRRSQRWVSLGLAMIGVIFLIVGAVSGQAMTVLNKAVHVCLECIGIG